LFLDEKREDRTERRKKEGMMMKDVDEREDVAVGESMTERLTVRSTFIEEQMDRP
jgi:hypothetical protein